MGDKCVSILEGQCFIVGGCSRTEKWKVRMSVSADSDSR